MEPELHSAGCCCLALSTFHTPLCQSITAINAGPQDTQQKGKTQWVARVGDLLAFPVKAEQELCCGLPLAKSIGYGNAMQCMYAIYWCNAMQWPKEAMWSCNVRHGMVLLAGGNHCFLYSIFVVSHTRVILETPVIYEFSIWMQGKFVFKNKCCIGDGCPSHGHPICISNYAKKRIAYLLIRDLVFSWQIDICFIN